MPIEPHLWVKDAEKAAEFLQRALGFVLRARFPDSGRFTWCALAHGDATVMLASPPGPAGGDDPGVQAFHSDAAARVGRGGPCSLYIPVNDADALHAHAVREGATIVEPLRNTFWNYRQFTAQDPEGNWFTFHHSIPRK